MDWTFLGSVLQAFGFDPKNCKLISHLISTSSLAILVNGAPSNFFKPLRSLRHGDPLSPIFFIIRDECFRMLIEKNKKEGRLKGIRPSSRNVSFTGGEASIRRLK